MTKESKTTKICAVFLILLLLMGFIRNDPWSRLANISEYLHLDTGKLKEPDSITPEQIEKDLNDGLTHRSDLIELSGEVSSKLGMRDYYGSNNIYMSKDGYLIGMYPQTSTDYEYEQTVTLYGFLKENGINLIYVNEPVKYSDDMEAVNDIGLETYVNRNSDLLLERLKDAGVPVIDLRDNARDEGIDVKSLFYRTDHHWTVPAGLWAARIMAQGLNEYAGYDIDPGIYDESGFEFTEYKNCWLGEQGRKVSAKYAGLDDFTEIKPAFPTSYVFSGDSGEYDGSFDEFVNEGFYSSDEDIYTELSWHYSYNL
ncbi:MAG: hypothetical protein K6F34_01465, partial [Lachnospiraceae bacterium]|nr:hypothetical protein [Lachnospiraceae bacterium]